MLREITPRSSALLIFGVCTTLFCGSCGENPKPPPMPVIVFSDAGVSAVCKGGIEQIGSRIRINDLELRGKAPLTIVSVKIVLFIDRDEDQTVGPQETEDSQELADTSVDWWSCTLIGSQSPRAALSLEIRLSDGQVKSETRLLAELEAKSTS